MCCCALSSEPRLFYRAPGRGDLQGTAAPHWRRKMASWDMGNIGLGCGKVIYGLIIAVSAVMVWAAVRSFDTAQSVDHGQVLPASGTHGRQ